MFTEGFTEGAIEVVIRDEGALQRNQKIRDYYGSEWVGPGLTRNFCVCENLPKIALNQC